MGRITARRRVTRIRRDQPRSARADLLAVEEPLEMRIDGARTAVTMRTPGDDVDLAVGYLLSEGVITTADDLVSAQFCAGRPDRAVGLDQRADNSYNILELTLAPTVRRPAPTRELTISSACGVCGKDSIDEVRTQSFYPPAADPLIVDAERILDLPDRLRAGQKAFEKTGGLHAAALFDGATGELLVLREDVGRHNAVDKVIGWALRERRLPLRGSILQVSGRASFELVQKAAMAGIPMLSAVSAPSSLAADLAEDSGITLIGFVRGESMVIYTRPDRVR